MKKGLIILVAASLLIFAYYITKAERYDKSVGPNDTITHNIQGTTNADRLIKFTDNIKHGKKDRINIVHYTVEGDPIITQLYFDGSNVQVAVDNTKDKFAGIDSRKIKYDTVRGGSKLIDNLMKYLSDNGI